MKSLEIENFGLKEMHLEELSTTNGGFLPLAVIVGIWAFQGACVIVALGMKARLDQE
ncbi:MAG: class IIb bacteriocin, lactobin A/cerein 7B family [Daejeonella sp.]